MAQSDAPQLNAHIWKAGILGGVLIMMLDLVE